MSENVISLKDILEFASQCNRDLYSCGGLTEEAMRKMESAINKQIASLWQPMETCPRDSMVLLDVGLPYAVAGSYNQPTEKYVYADIQVGQYNSEYNDTYFENEYEKTPKAWKPMPEVKKE